MIQMFMRRNTQNGELTGWEKKSSFCHANERQRKIKSWWQTKIIAYPSPAQTKQNLQHINRQTVPERRDCQHSQVRSWAERMSDSWISQFHHDLSGMFVSVVVSIPESYLSFEMKILKHWLTYNYMHLVYQSHFHIIFWHSSHYLSSLLYNPCIELGAYLAIFDFECCIDTKIRSVFWDKNTFFYQSHSVLGWTCADLCPF